MGSNDVDSVAMTQRLAFWKTKSYAWFSSLHMHPFVYLEGVPWKGQLETTRRHFGVMLHCGNFQHRGKDGRVMSVSYVLYN